MMDPIENGYSEVNGIQMYYEIYGEGNPLVLIHGGGSTIQTTFRNIIPPLAQKRKIIAMELQAHGRTGDRDAPLKFEQDADDVATLLKNIGIVKADFLGFSNGGQTLIELSLRHPQLMNKTIICSAFYKREATTEQFWKGFDNTRLTDMPESLRNGYLAVNNNQDGLQNMFNKDVQRMKSFTGWTDDQIKSIEGPVLIMNGNADVGSLEHIVGMYHTLPNAVLAILPGNHGSYIGVKESLSNGEWTQAYTVSLIEDFLDK